MPLGMLTSKLVFNIMLVFAEFERDMIVERTQKRNLSSHFYKSHLIPEDTLHFLQSTI